MSQSVVETICIRNKTDINIAAHSTKFNSTQLYSLEDYLFPCGLNSTDQLEGKQEALMSVHSQRSCSPAAAAGACVES